MMSRDVAAISARLWGRSELQDRCSQPTTVVSVHEHVGSETLEYPNGVDVEYTQTIEQMRHLLEQDWSALSRTPGAIAVGCIPMPWYTAYKRNVARVSDVYDERNLSMLSGCAVAQEAGGSLLPLPVLIVGADQTADEFESIYGPALRSVAALKWHPAAEQVPPTRFIEQGHLQLAAEHSLPVVLHCARVGTLGSLDEVLDDVLPQFAERGVRVDVAHAGFLHPRLAELANWPNAFTDCCPWSAICTSHDVPLSGPAGYESLVNVLSVLGANVVLGFDSPWHIQRWDDGTVHGKPIEDDLSVLARATAESGLNPSELVQGNALRLLFGAD